MAEQRSLLRHAEGMNATNSPPLLRREENTVPDDYEYLDDDDNRSVHSLPHSSSSSSGDSTSSWITNFKLLADDPAQSMNDFIQMSGGPSASTTLDSMLHYVFSMFPVVKELTNLYQPTTGRRPNTSIAEVVADLDKTILQAILEVTYETGPGARDKLFTAFNLFRNRTTTHRSQTDICYFLLHLDPS